MAFTLNPNVTLPYNEGAQFTPGDSAGIVNYASGWIVMDGTTTVAVEVPLGFTPRKVRVMDVTGNTLAKEWEYVDFLNGALGTAGNSFVTTYTTGAPNRVINTAGVLVINDSKTTAGSNRSFTMAASALTASHTYVFEAFA